MHPAYLPLLGATFLLYWFVVPPRLRPPLLLVASLVFAGLCTGPLLGLLLGLIVAVHLGLGQAGRIRATAPLPAPPMTKGRLVLCLTLLIGTLLGFKIAASLRPGHPGLLGPVGLSYVVFRLIHVTLEVYFRRLPAPTLGQLGAYTLFFPSFTAGPVDRLPHYQVSFEPRLDLRHLNIGGFRIGLGLAKKAFLAELLRRFVYPLAAGLCVDRPGELLLVSYGLLLVLYLDFSGYSDIAVGSARVLGMRLLENFDWPLLKPSLPEFWRAWHISVYTFIRDYFFLPLFATRASEWKLRLGLLLSFVVFMLWHRVNLVFLGLGIYLGLGLVLSAWFDRVMARRPWLRRLMRRRELRPVRVLITLTFIALGTAILHADGYLTTAMGS